MIGIAFGIVFLLVGIGIVGYYAKVEISKSKPDEMYEQTKAEVIGYEYSKEGQAAVVVKYVVDNEAYTMTSNCYSSNPERIGKQLKVEYDRRYPRKAVLISRNNDIIVVIVGGIFIFGSICMIYLAIKEREEQQDWIIMRGELC